ncbi:hypothetical protein A3H16_01520 [Candidatus Kaiserbacteria bacterium RIFCSPLOWO2_12_FULL_53_8]|uniref:Uncharacterized protein n=2 Tax=Candidatus Kaiseribacteriota TaxID=1752734 RepID=A0A1F6CW66_9BACT|nr:MAG: hypothetical protein A2851_00195 [Candidatus Kaiserbacteria bacterium RIFCSPHIGHO2_01_FULL_53_29]OGG91088.1 MAG: hypothetical protein A3H16_01520 [Candidatus Kaiserbacteria bacterium RIFCSPLOWO2_12_FULL_53_8]
MTTQIVFNIDPKIKAQAMKRAKREGVPFASVLKMATKAFADGQLSIGLSEQIRPEKTRLWERQSRLLDQGKGTRLSSMKEYREFIDSL